MSVNCGWEEQEILRFASLFKLGMQFGYDLLRGESLERFYGSHDPFSKSPSGITIWGWTDGSGTEYSNPEIGGGVSKTEHLACQQVDR